MNNTEPTATCEQCGQPIRDGEDANRWADGPVTHERCYPREQMAALTIPDVTTTPPLPEPGEPQYRWTPPDGYGAVVNTPTEVVVYAASDHDGGCRVYNRYSAEAYGDRWYLQDRAPLALVAHLVALATDTVNAERAREADRRAEAAEAAAENAGARAERLAKAIRDWLPLAEHKLSMADRFPAGTAGAEDAWSDFGDAAEAASAALAAALAENP